jgi:hypothetical protein
MVCAIGLRGLGRDFAFNEAAQEMWGAVYSVL